MIQSILLPVAACVASFLGLACLLSWYDRWLDRKIFKEDKRQTLTKRTRRHFLHVAFHGTRKDGAFGTSSFCADTLVVVERCTIGQLRRCCMDTCAAEGLVLEKEPTITSIDELSEDLFRTLWGDKPYNILNFSKED